MATAHVQGGLGEIFRSGSFSFVSPDGTTEDFGKGKPQFTIRLRAGSILDFLNDDPLMSFGEAYMNGQVDVHGDLADLISFAIRNGVAPSDEAPQGFARAFRRVASAGIRSLKRQKRDVAYHYDLGNDSFASGSMSPSPIRAPISGQHLTLSNRLKRKR